MGRPMDTNIGTAKSLSSRGVPQGEKGSTLIEVLAAVVIFSIVLTAAFATFIFQKQSYTTQTHVAGMQQNLRVALDTLSRDIRMAGYGVYSDITVPASVVGATGSPVVLRGIFGGDGGTTSPDGIYILYSYDMDNTVSALQPTLATASVTAVNSGTVIVNVTPGTGTRFPVGELVLLNNGSTADLYQVTSRDNNSLTFGSTPVINANGHAASNWYDVDSKVSRARFVRYWIDTTNAEHPVLMVTRLPGTVSQPVADDIEDLQFVYGIASSNDNALVAGTSDSPANDTDRQRIRRVNLSIIARTGVYEKGWLGQRPNLANRSGTAPTDSYRRRIIDNMVLGIRNIRLN
jgi:type IV pilus assembly protein PilW